MSHVENAAGGHDGTCGFCGTSVDRTFVTCTGCGATWRSAVNVWGHLAIKGSLVVAFPVAFVLGTVQQSMTTFNVALFGGIGLMLVLGLCMRTTAWFR